MQKEKNDMTNNYENQNDEFNLNLFFNVILRNKFLISTFSLTFFLIGCLYSLTVKRVWEGQFQIVLNTQNKQLTDRLFISKNDGLATEIQKLISPSVLMPIFEFANSSENGNNNNYSNFIKWKTKNLDVELIDNTSVLNIAYRDKNKEKIIPILEKMSNAYQEYSGYGKERTTNLQINFLKEQVAIYKEKSANSLKIAQEFATKEDLIYYDMNLIPSNIFEQEEKENATAAPISLILPNINIENIRVEAANEIRRINKQLEKINSIVDLDELMYFGATIPGLMENNLPSKLEGMEEKLVMLKSKYTDQDPIIKRMLIEKEQFMDLLKTRAISYLMAAKIQAEAKMESALRPKGILMKYKELVREASRDENTLLSLESQLRLLELEAAKKEDPWELITKPTLLKNPVAPSRRAIGLRSLLLGIIFGSAYVFFKEKNSDLIYETEVLKKLTPIRIISKIELKDNYQKDKEFSFLKDFLEKTSTSIISFLILEGIESKDLESLKRGIKRNRLKFYKNLKDIEPTNIEKSKYLLLKLGSTKISDIIKFRDYCDLYKTDIQGIIVFEDKNSISVSNFENEIKFKFKLIYNFIFNKISNSKSTKALINKIGSNSNSIISYLYDLLTRSFKQK